MIIRSDIHKIQIGKFVYIGAKCVIKPSLNLKDEKMEMGSYIFIDTDSVIRSRLIGNYVYIGKNVVIVCLYFIILIIININRERIA